MKKVNLNFWKDYDPDIIRGLDDDKGQNVSVQTHERLEQFIQGNF